jgi:hypothetical protein
MSCCGLRALQGHGGVSGTCIGKNQYLQANWQGQQTSKFNQFWRLSFGLKNVEVETESFKGPRRITSLPCYPIKNHRDYQNVYKQLIERGRTFVTVAGMHYKSDVGLGFIKVSVN